MEYFGKPVFEPDDRVGVALAKVQPDAMEVHLTPSSTSSTWSASTRGAGLALTSTSTGTVSRASSRSTAQPCLQVPAVLQGPYRR